MNSSTILRSLAVLTLSACCAFAQEEGERPAQSPVRAEMEKVEEALETVAEYAETFAGEAPVAALDTAVKGLQEAKQHAPRTADEKPEAERAAFVLAYRLELNKTIRALLDLEDAVLAKDKAAAARAMATLEKLQKDNHRIYKGRRRRGGRE